MRVVIIGAGMAGASLAYHLAAHADVTLLEAEDQPGYHTTGRSAAVYAKCYGNAVIRALTVASEPFYLAPPKDFSDAPLLTPLGALFVARHDQRDALAALYADIAPTVPAAEILSAAEATKRVPILRSEYIDQALFEPDSRAMDVNEILQGFLRGAMRASAKLVNSAAVQQLKRTAGTWQIATSAGTFEADCVVNAAGAWADQIGQLAGLNPCGIQPKRRTAFLVRPPNRQLTSHWPLTIDVEETFYVKPDAGMLLCSPADETPSKAMDAYPEDLDIAIAIDRIQKVMNLPVEHIGRSWAGLRSFAPDKTPVVGMDAQAEGFFWLAGQGGYGIQTAPAMGRLASHLISGSALDLELDKAAVVQAMSPTRLH